MNLQPYCPQIEQQQLKKKPCICAQWACSVLEASVGIPQIFPGSPSMALAVLVNQCRWGCEKMHPRQTSLLA